MTWSVLGPDGRVRSTYERHSSAERNSNGLRVVEGPPGRNLRDWRWSEAGGWLEEPAPDPGLDRIAAMSRDDRRRGEYARGDRDRMLEVAVEVVLAMAERPEVVSLLRQTTRNKIDALKDEIAAVKAAQP